MGPLGVSKIRALILTYRTSSPTHAVFNFAIFTVLSFALFSPSSHMISMDNMPLYAAGMGASLVLRFDQSWL